MYTEEELLPLSGLQHLHFCERQWALIHVEQTWIENRLTAEGRVLHERVHQSEADSRPGLRIVRGLRLQSLRMGLTGQADVVEFHSAGAGGIPLLGKKGLWTPFPVEYKRGRPKTDACDEVQLCAQALCLEEMYGIRIERGALYYGTPRRRTEVSFSSTLRTQTEDLAARMHLLYSSGTTPPPKLAPKCESCSLRDTCMPRTMSHPLSVGRYISRVWAENEDQ